jgi:hypothetical protein
MVEEGCNSLRRLAEKGVRRNQNFRLANTHPMECPDTMLYVFSWAYHAAKKKRGGRGGGK